MRQLRPLKTISTIGFAALVFSGAARADAAGDLTKLLNDYRQAEQKLRSAGERSEDRYDAKLVAANMDSRRRVNGEMRTRLAAIDPLELKGQDALSYEIFRWALDDEQRELKPGIVEHFQLLPLNQFDGQQI